jgi:hypothetical protein
MGEYLGLAAIGLLLAMAWFAETVVLTMLGLHPIPAGVVSLVITTGSITLGLRG